MKTEIRVGDIVSFPGLPGEFLVTAIDGEGNMETEKISDKMCPAEPNIVRVVKEAMAKLDPPNEAA